MRIKSNLSYLAACLLKESLEKEGFFVNVLRYESVLGTRFTLEWKKAARR